MKIFLNNCLMKIIAHDEYFLHIKKIYPAYTRIDLKMITCARAQMRAAYTSRTSIWFDSAWQESMYFQMQMTGHSQLLDSMHV